MSVEPTVDGLEGDTELLGKLGLTEPVFETILLEGFNQVHVGCLCYLVTAVVLVRLFFLT